MLNEHNTLVQAVMLQAIIVSIILLTTTLLPSVDAIYNVLVTMTALTSLFPYVILFRAYIKLRKDRPNEVRPYEMAKDNGKAISIANILVIIAVIVIVLSAAPVMPSLKENIVYELEMIGGALLVILIGLIKWNNFVKKTGFRE